MVCRSNTPVPNGGPLLHTDPRVKPRRQAPHPELVFARLTIGGSPSKEATRDSMRQPAEGARSDVSLRGHSRSTCRVFERACLSCVRTRRASLADGDWMRRQRLARFFRAPAATQLRPLIHEREPDTGAVILSGAPPTGSAGGMSHYFRRVSSRLATHPGIRPGLRLKRGDCWASMTGGNSGRVV